MAIERLFFYPPLAFARLGGSDTPLECFYWGDDDYRPHGTGKTTIGRGKTLKVSDLGEVAEATPLDSAEIKFKDGDEFRPVCPFFELHAAWRDDDGTPGEGPVTEKLLCANGGFSRHDLKWEITFANLKPFHLTQDPDTRIEAHATLDGDEIIPRKLCGRSPSGAENPLVPANLSIPFGSVRLTRPNDAFPELRLRFTPAKGHFYGPTDLKDRWKDLQLDDKYLFLNKNSAWCRWTSTDDDRRSTPGGQFAADGDGISYGMVDDTGDGVISCSLVAHPGSNLRGLVAYARVIVTPPDFAPDRRHIVSFADGLKDRVDRAEVFEDSYFDDSDLCDSEIRELMQRTFETAGLTNLDVYNDRVNQMENTFAALVHGIPFRPHEFDVYPHRDRPGGGSFPLTGLARETHRRLQVITVLKKAVRRDPDLLSRYLRPPLDRNPFFDKRMPLLMRGSTGQPLTLTRRQYEFLLGWAARQTGANGRDVGA